MLYIVYTLAEPDLHEVCISSSVTSTYHLHLCVATHLTKGNYLCCVIRPGGPNSVRTFKGFCGTAGIPL